MDGKPNLRTTVLPVDARRIGKLVSKPADHDILDDMDIELDNRTSDTANLRLAADQLRHSDIPVAFPTETVYGLGADATRSGAVDGIYKAKQRPADNPLIVHFASLKQLRDLLRPTEYHGRPQTNGHITNGTSADCIPEIYKPLISRFWPGPLTIILPNPSKSRLAPEVTAGLNTFGARIPRHPLALALIKLADVPVAAPSANASTKPSPTAAEHVAYDLDGRIETIVDGGPCDIGVESTVVDGTSHPPMILRPGGISMEQLRSCPGWENAQIGYKNVSEAGDRPRAPGMKYRHYSPKAAVVLYELGNIPPSLIELDQYLGFSRRLGVITTKKWTIDVAAAPHIIQERVTEQTKKTSPTNHHEIGFVGMLKMLQSTPDARTAMKTHNIQYNGATVQLSEIALGSNTAGISRGIFSALRELDRKNVDAILVEGIDDLEGDTAAAVMNRLRKAAEVQIAG